MHSRKIVSIEIDYPGSNNRTEFTFDCLGNCVRANETVAGSSASIKQFIWISGHRCEERDGSGALVKKFFIAGQVNGSTKYFYSSDLIGSIRSVADNSGNLVTCWNFDPYGRALPYLETIAPDFGYCGYYLHARSHLSGTSTRSYFAQLGRWLNRDPLERKTDVNPYAYVANQPMSSFDPSGLFQLSIAWTHFILGYSHADLMLVDDNGNVVAGWGGRVSNLYGPISGIQLSLAAKGSDIWKNRAGETFVVGGCDDDLPFWIDKLNRAANSIGLPWTGSYFYPQWGVPFNTSNTAVYEMIRAMGQPIPDPGRTDAYGWHPFFPAPPIPKL